MPIKTTKARGVKSTTYRGRTTGKGSVKKGSYAYPAYEEEGCKEAEQEIA
jgi:hypothetical protein